MSKLNYYFASWGKDSSDIFKLMESWWKDLPVKELDLDIDRERFRELHESNLLVTICARNAENELVSCFVGVVAPYLLHRGKLQLQQLAACFKKGYRTPYNYIKMIDTVEKICKKLNISILSPSTNKRMADIMIKRKGYLMDSTYIVKSLGE